jgi:choice-of-anchor A domain-containing protein
VAVLALSTGLVSSVVAVPIVNLGAAANYAVLGIGGNVSIQSDYKIYQSATVINGNVGEGPHTTLGHGIDGTVLGRWDYDVSNLDPSASGYTGNVTGGFHQMGLATAVADARAASTAAAAFAPTQTFSSLSEGQTIIGNAGLNVIRITGDSAIKTFLDIQGSASSTFVFQFTSPTTAGHDVLTLSGMTMNLLGGVQSGNIFWDFNALGGDVTITSMAAGQSVYGTFLAPDRNLLADHGIIEGRLIAGGSGTLLSIHSGSSITVPSVPDTGSTVLLLALAMLGMVRFTRVQLS